MLLIIIQKANHRMIKGDKIAFYFDKVPKKGQIFLKEFRQLT
jgi:hypothetical protein